MKISSSLATKPNDRSKTVGTSQDNFQDDVYIEDSDNTSWWLPPTINYKYSCSTLIAIYLFLM